VLFRSWVNRAVVPNPRSWLRLNNRWLGAKGSERLEHALKESASVKLVPLGLRRGHFSPIALHDERHTLGTPAMAAHGVEAVAVCEAALPRLRRGRAGQRAAHARVPRPRLFEAGRVGQRAADPARAELLVVELPVDIRLEPGGGAQDQSGRAVTEPMRPKRSRRQGVRGVSCLVVGATPCC